MEYLLEFEEFLNEEQWAKGVTVKKGKMHDILGIPEDKTVTDIYKDPKKLARDLVKKSSKKEANSMLAYPANLGKPGNIFAQAREELKNIEESVENT